MKIYIAGAITNNPTYKEDFKKAEEFIRSTGHRPFNPVLPEGSSYQFYIDRGLQELSKCDAIYMLENFEQSKGARLELRYAATVGLKIFDEIDPGVEDELRSLAENEKAH